MKQPAYSDPGRGIPTTEVAGLRIEPCVLLKYGEMALKGRNRDRFERYLVGNLNTR